MNSTSLRNQFLIAMPALADPNFSRTVTYICEHNEDGAMGIVINRPIEVGLGEIFSHMGVEQTDLSSSDQAVYLGGPVQQDRGFVIHRPLGRWGSSMLVTDRVAVTISPDILHSLAKGEGPEASLVALGYAGWGAGQLEDEIAQNAWLSGPADEAIIFDLPDDQRWQAAADLMGVDLNLLTMDAGHA